MRRFLSLVVLVAVAALCVPTDASASPPTVVSTEPANGATGVAPDLPQIVLTFDKGMSGGYSFTGLSGGWSGQWSQDQRSLTLSRPPALPPWSDRTIVTMVLNPPPYLSFVDLEGNPLGTYAFSFTVGAAVPGAPTVVETAPANGATGVSTSLQSLVITFSETMGDGVSLSASGPWLVSGTTSLTWSADRRTLTVSRDDLPAELPPSSVVTIVLNPGGSGFGDPAGNPLGTYSFSFTTAAPAPEDPPEVVDTDPADGARDAGRFLQAFSITFSKAMQPGHAIVCDAGGWDLDGSAVAWSPDRRTLSITRPQDDRLLPAGTTFSFVLNPPGSQGFVDVDGNPLATTTFAFTVETPSRLIKVVPEDSTRDFSWPYYLWIPGGLEGSTALLVEPNNTGTVSDVEQLHDSSALSLLGWRASFAARLGVPLLVPTFPRPRSHWTVYTHALDRDSLVTTMEGIERIDLQLLEMIDDARERLGDLGIVASERVLMMGFSASGQFTNRFAILHPERILAAAAGSPGGWPLAPVDRWQGETLDYNVGIADVEALAGIDIDPAELRAVPLFLYMGDADTNDSVPFSDGYDQNQREQVNRLFGTTPVERWPHAEAIYAAAGMNATFRLYPGIGHTISNQMFDDVAAFFTGHLRPSRTLAVRKAGSRVAPP